MQGHPTQQILKESDQFLDAYASYIHFFFTCFSIFLLVPQKDGNRDRAAAEGRGGRGCAVKWGGEAGMH